MFALPGSCDSFPACVAFDCTECETVVSTTFALSYNLPRTFSDDCSSLSTRATIWVPTPGGGYSLSVSARVRSVREYDVVLGANWSVALGVCDGMSVLPDPVMGTSLPAGVSWYPSPAPGACLLCVGMLHAEATIVLRAGYMASACGAMNHEVAADDRPAVSSSSGLGSAVCEAGASSVAPNVAFAVQTLFPLNEAMHIFGNRASSTRLAALCLAHGLTVGSDLSCQLSLLRHIVSGQCALHVCRTRCAGCLELAGVYETPSALRDDILQLLRPVLYAQSLSVQWDIGVLVGVDDGDVSRMLGVMRTLTCLPPSDILTDLGTLLDELPTLPAEVLCAVANAHNVDVGDGTCTVMANNVALHVASGICGRRPLSARGSACSASDDASSLASEVDSRDDLQSRVLTRLVPRLNLSGLRSVCHSLALSFDYDTSISKLRRKLTRFIKTMEKGKAPQTQPSSRSGPPSAIDRGSVRDVESDSCGWPQRSSSALNEELVRAFRRETSSERLATFVCASCAGSYSTSERRVVDFDDLPPELFACPPALLQSFPDAGCLPLFVHSNVRILLHPSGIHDDGILRRVALCNECSSFVRRERVPPLALANWNFLGEVPDELAELMFIEEQILALCRAKSAILHLRDDGGASIGNDDPEGSRRRNAQRGFKGHIVTYPQRPEEIADVLPRGLQHIMTPICIIFVGSKPPTLAWLREKATPLIVRRERVERALRWLVVHNPLYAHVRVDDDAIRALPENDILPAHVERVPASAAQEVLTSRYDEGVADDEDDREEESHVSSRTIDRASVAFSKVVVTDVDGSAPANELRAAALRHIKQKGGGYLEVPHGPQPENEFCNPTLFPKIYPTLFPYGVGGFEDDRRHTPLSFQRQVRHLLTLADRRFQEHHSFIFTAFNILQRRAVLLHSSLKVRKSSFATVAADYATLPPDVVSRVCARVGAGVHMRAETDDERRVLRLMDDMQLVTRNVPGSTGARVAMRNQVRGLMYSKGMPSFFLTINPADVYNPVVKFLAGADIDVDKLLPSEEPDYWQQSLLVARNPIVATQFFHKYMTAFVKTLLGWDSSSRVATTGALGIVKAFYGCIEAQGRGTLHCHMLVWVDGALSPSELRSRLLRRGGDHFGERLLAYLDDLIRTSSPPLPSGARRPETRSKKSLTTRGFDLRKRGSDCSAERAMDLFNLVEACQRHSHTDTCYKYCDTNSSRKTCRFELDEFNVTPRSTIDHDTGTITLQHLDGLVNNYNPTLLEALRCNMDIKFIGGGIDTMALVYYITDYITKSPLKAHVAYAALERALTTFREMTDVPDSTTEAAKRLLRKCAFSITANQELSAQQVALHLLGYDDFFTSDEYANLYWTSAERYLDSQLRSPECSWEAIRTLRDAESGSTSAIVDPDVDSTLDDDREDGDNVDPRELDDPEDDVTVDGSREGELLMLSDQLTDYVFRSPKLKDVNVWDFIAQTIKVPRPKNKVSDNSDSINLADVTAWRCEYADFLPGHPEFGRKCLKLLRSRDKRVPVPMGPRLPRRDRENEYPRYCRLMLLLFEPWRTCSDLRRNFPSWPTAFEAFLTRARNEHICVMDNMQLMHECRDSRDDHMRDREKRRRLLRDRLDRMQEANVARVEESIASAEDEVDILEHLQNMQSSRSHQHAVRSANALHCVSTLHDAGFYATCGRSARVPPIRNEEDLNALSINDHKLESAWRAEYEARRKTWKNLMVSPHTTAGTSNTSAESELIWQHSLLRDQRDLVDSESRPHLADALFLPSVPTIDISQFAKSWNLNAEQTRAFRMIADHSYQSSPTPLWMYIGGVGGTGKSRVIRALRAFFFESHQSRRLRLSSYTGVAALNVGGVTLHSALSLEQRKGDTTEGRTHRDLSAMWEGVDYLLIDEVSMIGCRFLAQINRALQDAKENKESPFGGMSVILAGDFAQLPPVAETRLYAWINTSRRQLASNTGAMRIITGKILWLMFTKVVILEEVVRQQGEANLQFVGLLSRLRVGECTDADYDLLNSRLLSNISDGTRLSEWTDAPLIVSDNAAKDAINFHAAAAFARNTNQQLQWYYAADHHKGKLVTDDALLAHLDSMHSGQTQHRLSRIPLVLGMPVIITQNFDIEGGIVNGTIGHVRKIRYVQDAHTLRRRLVSCIIRVCDATAPSMEPLSTNEYPVLEDAVDMKFTHPHSGRSITIKRTQLPLEPAFALTAHKAQGQTFDRVVVDLESCSGTESPYVMLSRATSLQSVVILRPFSKKKIRCRSSQDVRNEFHRLRRLQLRTKIVHGSASDKLSATSALHNEFHEHAACEYDREDPSTIMHDMNADPIATLDRLQRMPHTKRAITESEDDERSSKRLRT